MLNKSFAPLTTLTTERLTLRQLRPDDEQAIFALRSDSENNRYLDRHPARTIDDARSFINKVNENIQKNEALYWAITLSGSQTLAGTICLFSFSEELGKCEIGYELLGDFQGQGLMQEALQTVIAYGFQAIKLQKIEAITHKDNLRSAKLLEKFSFRKSTEPVPENPSYFVFTLTSNDNQ